MAAIFKTRILLTGAPLALAIGNAQADCVPYDTVLVPEKFECTTSNTTGDKRFDDFSSGSCKKTPAHYIQVPKECPPPEPGLWVQRITKQVQIHRPYEVYTPQYETVTLGHAATCATVGLVASHLNGAVCASGGLMPGKGGGWDKIKYPFGIAGKVGDGGGKHARYFPEKTTYCYTKPPKKKDPDDILIAWFCNVPGSPPPPSGAYSSARPPIDWSARD